MNKSILAAGALALLMGAAGVPAVDFGNMMNPSKWFNGNDDDDRYRGGDRSYAPPPGYGPPSGRGGYTPGPYPGYRGNAPSPYSGYRGGTPGPGGTATNRPMPRSPEECAARIRELEARIIMLEANQKQGAAMPNAPVGAQAPMTAPQPAPMTPPQPAPQPRLNAFPPAPR